MTLGVDVQEKIPVDIVMRVGQKGVQGARGPVGFQVFVAAFFALFTAWLVHAGWVDKCGRPLKARTRWNSGPG